MLENRQISSIRLALFAFAIFMAGCVQDNSTMNSDTSEQVFPTPISSPSTRELNTTASPDIFDLAPNHVNPTLQATDNPIRPLTDKEAYSELKKLLNDNAACKLPCLWGIVPGKTTQQEGLEILNRFTGISEQVYLSGDGTGSISPILYDDDMEIYTRLAYVTHRNDPVIERVLFTSSITKISAEGKINVYNSMLYKELTSYFRLDHLLSELGTPAAVLLHTYQDLPSNGRGSELGVYLIVIYPDKGVLAEYTTSWRKEGGNIIGCFASAHLKMHLSAPGTNASFEEALSQTEWSGLWPVPIHNTYWRELGEATSYSNDEFEEVFRQPGDQCLFTPAEIWPVPEG